MPNDPEGKVLGDTNRGAAVTRSGSDNAGQQVDNVVVRISSESETSNEETKRSIAITAQSMETVTQENCEDSLNKYLDKMGTVFSEPLKDYVLPSELEALRITVDEAKQWAVLQKGSHFDLPAHQAQLFSLQAAGDPIFRRHQESMERPSALWELLHIITLFPTHVNDRIKFPRLDPKATGVAFDASERIAAWLDAQLTEQAELPITSDPVLTVANLQERRQEIESFIDALGPARLPQYRLDRLVGNSSLDMADLTTLAQVGLTFRDGFEATGEVAYLEKSICLLDGAAKLTPISHLDKLNRLNDLGIELFTRFTTFGQIADLTSAISNLTSAINLTPDNHPAKVARLNNVGMLLEGRYSCLSDTSDLDLAIVYETQAVSLAGDDDDDKPAMISNLGNSYQNRFEALGKMVDLESAIAFHSKALDVTPDGHTDKPRMMSNMGASLNIRYEQLGRIADLDSAILYAMKAASLTQDSHISKALRLSNLGVSLENRFERLKNIADLNLAIEKHSEAVTLTPDRHPDKARMVMNLSVALRTKFNILENIVDLDAAILHQRNSIHLTPDSHPMRPGRLSELGNSFLIKFNHTEEMPDLNLAISNHSEAVALTPNEQSDKPSILANLGISLQVKFKYLHNIEDINLAVSKLSQAIDLVPNGYPSKARNLNNLGVALKTKFDILKDTADLEAAINAFSCGASQVVGPPTILFGCSVQWMYLARNLINGAPHKSLMKACTSIVQLLPQVAWIGLDIQHRLGELRDLPSIACDVAACAIEQGNYEQAVEWLEQGRSIIWGQMLHLRTPVDALKGEHPDLAEELMHVAKELEYKGVAQSLSVATSEEPESLEVVSQKYRRFAERWEQLLKQVQLLPGFEHFLLPKKFADLAQSSVNGPVIILNASMYHCDALVLKSPEDPIIFVPLPNISHGQLIDFRQDLPHQSGRSADILGNDDSDKEPKLSENENESNMRHIQKTRAKQVKQTEPLKALLQSLWISAIQPIIAKLVLEKSDKPPHVWWCPTGPFASLPIHASGIYDSGPCTSDFMVSSYITTLDAFISQSDPSGLHSPFKLLAISQQNTPGATSLPLTVEEVNIIRRLAPPSSFMSLEGSSATVEETISHIVQSTWVHLACHGKQDISSPIESAFLLYDGNLKLSTLMQQSLSNAKFAFLSACQTATGDRSLSDEATHLAAGLLFAGFHGVMATLWSIADADGPVVSEAVYSQLLAQNQDPDITQCAFALHNAIIKLRNKGVSVERWAPFIHMGR